MSFQQVEFRDLRAGDADSVRLVAARGRPDWRPPTPITTPEAMLGTEPRPEEE